MLSIVVLTCNRKEDVAQNLPKLAEWSRLNSAELIVVDNNSSDGTLKVIERIRSEYSHLQLISNSENFGVGAGRNMGFRIAQGEIIICLDDDSDPSAEFLNDVIPLFGMYPEMGILVPKIIHPKTGFRQNDHGDNLLWVANFHGSCHAIRTLLFDQIGFLDEECSFGGEELDFSIRCNKIGFRTLYHPDYVSFHNSYTRPQGEQMKRWGDWIYNYARVIGKNFPKAMAEKLAMNYINQYAWKFKRVGDIEGAKDIRDKGLRGFERGTEQFNGCPESTVNFYSNPTLMPEYGNISTMRKVLQRLPLLGSRFCRIDKKYQVDRRM